MGQQQGASDKPEKKANKKERKIEFIYFRGIHDSSCTPNGITL
jgi:hypothetical protein